MYNVSGNAHSRHARHVHLYSLSRLFGVPCTMHMHACHRRRSSLSIPPGEQLRPRLRAIKLHVSCTEYGKLTNLWRLPGACVTARSIARSSPAYDDRPAGGCGWLHLYYTLRHAGMGPVDSSARAILGRFCTSSEGDLSPPRHPYHDVCSHSADGVLHKQKYSCCQ